MPQALALGVSFELFWSPGFSPREVEAFIKAHELRIKEQDQMQNRLSYYINAATYNAIYNGIGMTFGGKKFSPVSYESEAFSSRVEEGEDGGKRELTVEEKREATIRYFELLELQAFNHRQSQKENQKAEVTDEP